MKAATFQGEAKNFGRFGWVTPGQLLILNDSEWEQVKTSTDFIATATTAEERGNTDLDRMTKEELLAVVAGLPPEAQERITATAGRLPNRGRLIQSLKRWLAKNGGGQ